MSVIHNERTKLLANALDRLSTAFLALGLISPAAAALLNDHEPPIYQLLALASAAIFIALLIHLLPR